MLLMLHVWSLALADGESLAGHLAPKPAESDAGCAVFSKPGPRR